MHVILLGVKFAGSSMRHVFVLGSAVQQGGMPGSRCISRDMGCMSRGISTVCCCEANCSFSIAGEDGVKRWINDGADA